MPFAVYDGQEVQIPFDPIFIASLIYRGIEVYPDKNTSEANQKREKDLVQQHLRTLWGNQGMRTKTERGAITQNPAIREDERFSGRILPRENQGADFINVVPNPFVKNKIGIVDDSKLPAYQERIRTAPKTTQLWNLTNEQRDVPTFSYGLRQA